MGSKELLMGFSKTKDVEFTCRRCHAAFSNGICSKCGCEEYDYKVYKRIYETTRKLLFWTETRLVSEVIVDDSTKPKKHGSTKPAEVIHIPLQKYTEVF
jgi:hypothetical protein